MLRAAYVFAGSILTVGAATAAVIAVGGGSRAADAIALILFEGLLFVAGSTVNLFFRFLKLKVSYRCPECRGRPARVYEALPAVHFYCPTCNVEWDTGLQERGSVR